MSKTDFASRDLKDRVANLENKLPWKFLGYYDITTTNQTTAVPNANECLVVVGVKNSDQVYGGHSYIIPRNENGKNIIVSGAIYDGSGTMRSQKGVYIYISGNTLYYRAIDIVSGALILRVYYR